MDIASIFLKQVRAGFTHDVVRQAGFSVEVMLEALLVSTGAPLWQPNAFRDEV